jgi:hypothetical protein
MYQSHHLSSTLSRWLTRLGRLALALGLVLCLVPPAQPHRHTLTKRPGVSDRRAHRGWRHFNRGAL